MVESIVDSPAESKVPLFKTPFDSIYFHVFEHEDLLHLAPLLKIGCTLSDDLTKGQQNNHESRTLVSPILKEFGLNQIILVFLINFPFLEVKFVVF